MLKKIAAGSEIFGKTLSAMKKIMLCTAALLAACLTMSAQKKGDFTVGGSIGVSGGGTSASYSIQGNKTTEKTPNSTTFNLSPKFGYFVIDNLELTVGLDYSMQKDFAGRTSSDDNLFSFTHIAMATIGVNYYVPIISDKLFYVPGAQFGFGGGSVVTQNSNNNSTTQKVPFAFGFDAEHGTIEFKPLDFLGVSLNFLDLSVAYATTGEGNGKTNTTNFAAGLNYYPIPEVVIKGEYSHRFLKSQYDDEPSVSLGVAYAGFFTK